MNKKRDGHVHSKYCPHGSNDSMEEYLNVAISKGLQEITFTEHMALPQSIIVQGMEETFLKTASPSIEELDKYFEEVKKVKEIYKDKIKVNIGLEVDYIEGYEEETEKILNKYGDLLEDSILSVHLGKYDDKYYCLDCIESFEELLKIIGNIEKIYDLYYNTILKAIKSNLGEFKPKRIGHPTLVRIFNKKYPIDYKNNKIIEDIIKEIKEKGYELDFNTSGLRKKLCGEVYPSGYFYELAVSNHVPMVYGSDSHEAASVGFNIL